MSTRFQLCIFLLMLAASGCRKTDPSTVDLGYAYFPDRMGSYIIYRVDSLAYGISTQNYSYELKEILADQFIDGQGEAATRVERYVRPDSAAPWVLRSVWVQKRTTRSAQRVEENIRYVRMAFPLEEDKRWNGNAYNTLGNQEYSVVDLGRSRTYNDLPFGRTVRVNQRNQVNLIEQRIAFEVYAAEVGLVYKQIKDVSTSAGQSSGYEYFLSVLDYGIEN